MKQPDCGFCRAEDDPDIEVIFQDDLVLYCQNQKVQGSLKYSGVIIPKAHRETVFELTEDEISATFKMLKKVRHWLGEKHRPSGYNIGWNCYEVGGQHLPLHSHLHVIPRFTEEPLAGKGIRSLLKAVENKW